MRADPYDVAETLASWHLPVGKPVCTTETKRWGTVETWSLPNGDLHRLDGPALVERHRGVARRGLHHVRGVLHRLDGPARSTYSDKGEPIPLALTDYADFSVLGVAVGDHAGVVEFLTRLSPEHLALAVTESSFGALLLEGVEARDVLAALTEEIFTPEGVRAFASGAPVEWVRAFEEAGGTEVVES